LRPRFGDVVAIRISDMARWADEAREKRAPARGTRLAVASVCAPGALGSIANRHFKTNEGDMLDRTDTPRFKTWLATGAVSLLVLGAAGAHATPVITSLEAGGPAHAQAGSTVIILAEGLVEPIELFFSDGANPTVQATSLEVDTARGVVVAKVPAGSTTGDMKLTANAVDSAPYYFRIDAGTFDQGTRTVSGQVLDDGNPVGGTLLLMLSFGGCDDETFQDFALSDRFGNYTLTGPDGDYEVIAFPPLASGMAVALASATLGATPATLDIDLVAGTTVDGRIVRADSPTTGVENARVEYESDDGFDFVLTDSSGDFTLQLMPGDGEFWVQAPKGAILASLGEQPATVDPVGPQDVGDIELGTGVRITGLVRGQTDGLPLPNVELQVRASGTCCDAADEVYADGSGAFTLVVAPGADYDIQAYLDDDQPYVDLYEQVTVGAGDLVRNLDLEDAGFITGHVTDADTTSPIFEISVQAEAIPFENGPSAWTRTCEDGSYRLRVPPSATGYRTYAGYGEDFGYVPIAWDGTVDGTLYTCEGQAISVLTAGTEVANIDMKLPPNAARINGNVLTQASGCTQLIDEQQWIQVDDGVDHFCGLGVNDWWAPNGTFADYGLPHSALVPSLRACTWGPGDTSPQCWNLKHPPAHIGIVAAENDDINNVNFCMGNTPITGISDLMVGKSGDQMTFSWGPSTDPYHENYLLRGATTAVPSSGAGDFPNDPPFFEVYWTQSPDASLSIYSPYSYFLVTDVGLTSNEGPSDSYGN